MSLPAIITPVILDKVLGTLALLFLTSAGGDLPTARHAASRLLAAYNAETEEELRLAADIISFGFHALDALGKSVNPDLKLKDVLSLQGRAVSLNRQSHASQRKLDQIQRNRPAAIQPEPLPEAAITPPDQPVPEQPAAAEPPRPPAKANLPSRALTGQQRRARQITENLARNAAEQASRDAIAVALPHSDTMTLQAAE